MSEKKDDSLNIKRSWKGAEVKYSTPAEVSTLPQNALSISPMPQKVPRHAHFFKVQPLQAKGQSSMHLLRSLSVVPDPSQEFSTGSQFTFPTRRLSTITGSEESSETLHQTIIPPEMSGGRTRDFRRSERKSQKVVMEQEAKGGGRPASEVFKDKSKAERNLRKQLVERRVRAWELRQLINIEEAVAHELVVEEV